MKKVNHKQEIGSYGQIILGTITIIFGIMSMMNDDFFLIAELFIGLLMLVIAYNNQVVFKRKKFTYIYVIVGVLVIAYAVYGLISGKPLFS